MSLLLSDVNDVNDDEKEEEEEEEDNYLLFPNNVLATKPRLCRRMMNDSSRCLKKRVKSSSRCAITNKLMNNVYVYSEAKKHDTARVSRFLFVSHLPEYFFLNPNLGFWCFFTTTKRTKIFRKRLLCDDDDDIDDDDDDAEKEKRGRALLRVILIFFDDKKNEPC